MNAVRRRKAWMIALAVVSGAFIGGFGVARMSSSDSSKVATSSADDRFWGNLRLIAASEKEFFPTLAEMTSKADAVVLGEMVDLQVDRTIQGDSPEDQVTYARVDIAVERPLRGGAASRVSLDILLPNFPTRAKALEAEPALKAGLPTDRMVFFLRKQQTAPHRYRLVNSLGLWSGGAGRAPVYTPLASGGSGRTVFAAEAAGLRGIDELADYVSKSP